MCKYHQVSIISYYDTSLTQKLYLHNVGVDDGMSIRLVNQGDSGVKGGRAGHLYIKLSVPPDEVFKREGPNVHTDIPITVGQAILGGTVMVPTLAGQDLEIKVTLSIHSVYCIHMIFVPQIDTTGHTTRRKASVARQRHSYSIT